MKSLITTILLITLTSNVLAAGKATALKLGDLAPYDGVLLDNVRANEARNTERQVKLLEAKIEAQKGLQDFHRDQAMEARSKLLGSELKGNMKGLYGFVLGILTMSIAFKVSQEVR